MTPRSLPSRTVRTGMFRSKLAASLSLARALSANEAFAGEVRVDATASSEIQSFRPERALGAGIDRLTRAWTDVMYDPANLKTVLEAGWGAV